MLTSANYKYNWGIFMLLQENESLVFPVSLLVCGVHPLGTIFSLRQSCEPQLPLLMFYGWSILFVFCYWWTLSVFSSHLFSVTCCCSELKTVFHSVESCILFYSLLQTAALHLSTKPLYKLQNQNKPRVLCFYQLLLLFTLKELFSLPAFVFCPPHPGQIL